MPKKFAGSINRSSFQYRNNKGKIPVSKILQGVLVVVLIIYIGTLRSTRLDVSKTTPITGQAQAQAQAQGGQTQAQAQAERQALAVAITPKIVNVNANTNGAPVIGYAVSVTGCGSDPLEEGAAVLKHSIHLTSIHGTKGGKYDYKMYAIYHPQAKECVQSLAQLGYELLERETPVKVADIQGEYLRTHIEKNGCCGEKELIKLEAYTLIQHPVVVHLDLDVLVLKPLDQLFDAMIHGKTASNAATRIKVQWPNKPFAERPNAFITRDYNMNRPGNPYPMVQGGFLVIRPDLKVYDEYKKVVIAGDFQRGKGWGGKVGNAYGGMTIQGLVPFFYDILHPEDVVELDPCEYNQMCHNPRDKPTVNDQVNGRCRTGEEDCQDCRSLPLEKVYTTHYTLCQKPWWCQEHGQDRIQDRLCRKLHHAWYEVRADLEKSWGRPEGKHKQWKHGEHFFGYCKTAGARGYVPIAKPYGGPAA